MRPIIHLFILLILPTFTFAQSDNIFNCETSDSFFEVKFSNDNINVAIFIDPDTESIKYAGKTNCDRIELYTELYANNYHSSRGKTVKLYSDCSSLANEIGLKVNAGHDLSLENIEFFSKNMPFLDEVSIGHALISESLYMGLENVINLYINKLNK